MTDTDNGEQQQLINEALKAADIATMNAHAALVAVYAQTKATSSETNFARVKLALSSIHQAGSARQRLEGAPNWDQPCPCGLGGALTARERILVAGLGREATDGAEARSLRDICSRVESFARVHQAELCTGLSPLARADLAALAAFASSLASTPNPKT